MKHVFKVEVMSNVVLDCGIVDKLDVGDKVEILELTDDKENGVIYSRSIPEDREIHIPAGDGEVHLIVDYDKLGLGDD